MAKQDIAAQQENSQVRPVEKFVEFLTRRIEEDSHNGSVDLSLSQLDRILMADNVQEMWDSDDLDSSGGRDLEDVEQQINAVIYRESDRYESGILLPNGLRAYVIVRSQRLDNGEEFVWNTGAVLLIGKLRWLEAAGYLGTPDAQCVIRGRDASEGRVLKLKPVPQRAVPGSVS